MIKLIVPFLALVLTGISCTRTERSTIFNNDLLQYDTSIIAILTYDTSFYIFEDGVKAQLTADDITKIDLLMSSIIAEINEDQSRMFDNKELLFMTDDLRKEDILVKLRDYKRQYVTVLRDNGDKEVYVNCFNKRINKDTWRKNIIDGLGGGTNFFSVYINVTRNNYYELSVNSPM
jgi:hypothetical protein